MEKIIIYTMNFCPYCDRAKALFRSKGWAFDEIKLSESDDKAWADLEAKTKYKTVPQIFVGNRFLGGYTDIADLDRKGELEKIVCGS